MSGHDNLTRNERGMALVVALLVLLTLSALASAMLMTVTSDTRVSGHGVRESRSLNFAEAGITEAIARIRSGEISMTPNPKMVAQIFLTPPGQVPTLGPDSLALVTAQPSNSWLTYSTRDPGPDALTVTFKTDPARTMIYRYDPEANPHIQTNTGSPIFVITSTGRVGGDKRTVVAEVIASPFHLNAKGALVSGGGVSLNGSFQVCGFNHRDNTPAGTGEKGRLGSGGCNENPLVQKWETGQGDVAGTWSTLANLPVGSGGQEGVPGVSTYQTNFYAGPWEALGFKQAEFYKWLKYPVPSVPPNPKGLIYLDNNTMTQDASGSWSIQGGKGEGLLYCDGDLTLTGNFDFEGMIYVEGNLKMDGNVWVLGTVITKGNLIETAKVGGNMTILYSYDAIVNNLTKYFDQFINLSWREL